MSIFKNETKVKDLYKGNSKIKVAYVGDKKFYETQRWFTIENSETWLAGSKKMVVVGNKIYVSTGGRNISIFDTTTQKFIGQVPYPTEVGASFNIVIGLIVYNNYIIIHLGSSSSTAYYLMYDTTTNSINLEYSKQIALGSNSLIRNYFVYNNQFYMMYAGSGSIYRTNLPNLNETGNTGGSAKINSGRSVVVKDDIVYAFGMNSTSSTVRNYSTALNPLTFSTLNEIVSSSLLTNVYETLLIDNLVFVRGDGWNTNIAWLDLYNFNTWSTVQWATGFVSRYVHLMTIHDNKLYALYGNANINYLHVCDVNERIMRKEQNCTLFTGTGFKFVACVGHNGWLYCVTENGGFARYKL